MWLCSGERQASFSLVFPFSLGRSKYSAELPEKACVVLKSAGVSLSLSFHCPFPVCLFPFLTCSCFNTWKASSSCRRSSPHLTMTDRSRQLGRWPYGEPSLILLRRQKSQGDARVRTQLAVKSDGVFRGGKALERMTWAPEDALVHWEEYQDHLPPSTLLTALSPARALWGQLQKGLQGLV